MAGTKHQERTTTSRQNPRKHPYTRKPVPTEIMVLRYLEITKEELNKREIGKILEIDPNSIYKACENLVAEKWLDVMIESWGEKFYKLGVHSSTHEYIESFYPDDWEEKSWEADAE